MLDVEKLALEAGCDKLEHLTKGDREFLDRFAAIVLEAAAVQCDSKGHKWSGAPAHAFFELAAEIRAMKTGEGNE
jgi:hypothetical protein